MIYLDKGEVLVADYFRAYCNKVLECSPFFFKFAVSTEMDKFVPFRLNVGVFIYDVMCHSKEDFIKFTDSIEHVFKEAQDKLKFVPYTMSGGIKVDIKIDTLFKKE